MKKLNQLSVQKKVIFELFNYVPHSAQYAVHVDGRKFKFVTGGAQSGKTLLATMEAIPALLSEPTYEDTRAWVVGPKYLQVDRIFYRGIYQKIQNSQFKNDFTLSKFDRKLTCKHDGSWIQGRSADNPQDLAAEELDFIIVDEAPRCKADTFQFLLSRLITRKGWLLAIGTPVGRNWFHTEYLKGQTGDDVNTVSYRMPTTVNPYIDQREIQILKDKMPTRWYRQEIEGEFVEDASAVFSNIPAIVDSTITVNLRKPNPYTIGLDLGQVDDYTVALAFNNITKKVEGCLRTKGNWMKQKDEIIDFCRAWNGIVFLDATGASVGRYLLEVLLKERIKAVGVNLDRLTKEEIIGRLQMAVIEQSIKVPNLRFLLAELEGFQFIRKSNSLLVKMQAPSGLHDDGVIALALCLHGYTQQMGKAHYL